LTNTNIRHVDAKKHSAWQAFDLLVDPTIVFNAETLAVQYMNKASYRLVAEHSISGSNIENAQSILGMSADELHEQLAKLPVQGTEALRLSVRHAGYQSDVSLQLGAVAPTGQTAIAVFRDITKQVEIEKQKTELISTVSHELRSPLTAIKGAMALILSGAAGEASEKMLQMVKICHRNADRLILIINDILDLDKMTDGAMVFDNENVQLVQLVNEAIEAVDGFKERFDVMVHIDVVDANLTSFVDPNRMVQVLVNLLSNAIKFSLAGDRVTIRLLRHGDQNRMSVIDNGEGIPIDNQDTLFGRFVQVGAKNRAATGGTGLGLSIVQAIVKNQGGVISFESEVGVGTTFHVDLPSAADAQNDVETDVRRLG
jgi:signal transduction histidine kinase